MTALRHSMSPQFYLTSMTKNALSQRAGPAEGGPVRPDAPRRALRLFGTSAALARSPVTLAAASSKGKPAASIEGDNNYTPGPASRPGLLSFDISIFQTALERAWPNGVFQARRCGMPNSTNPEMPPMEFAPLKSLPLSLFFLRHGEQRR